MAKAGNAIQPDQVDDLLACLYGLYALLRLHFLQEEENYFTLTDEEVEKAPTQGKPMPHDTQARF